MLQHVSRLRAAILDTVEERLDTLVEIQKPELRERMRVHGAPLDLSNVPLPTHVLSSVFTASVRASAATLNGVVPPLR